MFVARAAQHGVRLQSKKQMVEPKKQESIAAAIFVAFVIVSIICTIAFGLTSIELGLLMGIAFFGIYLVVGLPLTLAIGLWALLCSAGLFVISVWLSQHSPFLGGRYSLNELLTLRWFHSQSYVPPYFFSHAAAVGIWGIFLVIASILRRLWKS